MNNGFLNKFAFWRKAANSGELGVYVGVNSVWVYQAKKLEQPESFTEFDLVKDNFSSPFNEIKNQFGTAKLQVVLSSPHYELLQADKPNVDPAEVCQALMWAIKDMVTQPVANIHLDYFESTVSTNSKVNVVVTPRDKLVSLATACDELGFTIAGITIEELALTPLFDADNMAHMLVTHLPDEELLFTVIKAGELLMQRRVRGFNQLHKASDEQLSYGLADNLSLEIQRSMDYFESQLRQAPVSSINLLTEGQQQTLVKLVAANFNQQVKAVTHHGVPAYLAQLAFNDLARGEA